MSFPSCIKIPASKSSVVPEFSDSNSVTKESISYNKLISIANDVFGHGRWSHSITSQTVDFVEYVMGKYHIGCAAFVRVQLADGTFHEDMGYSNKESAAKGQSIFSARSSSITLALKKALLCFGGVIEERINETIQKSSEDKQETNKLKEERNHEVSVKVQKDAGSCVKEAKSVTNAVPLKDSCEIKQPAKPLQSVSTPHRNKSPRPKEPEDVLMSVATDVEVILTDKCQETNKGIIADHTNATTKDGPSTAMTEEDIRLERKRKQRQKQEEYKKLMKEKQMKSDDKPNPRF